MSQPPIVFLDLIAWSYGPETPWQEPLGGTQSAVAYLSAALAAQGREVVLINQREQATVERGVRCLPVAIDGPRIQLGEEAAGLLAEPKVPVIIAGFGAGQILRAQAGIRGPMLLWIQHAHDQPAAVPLTDPATRRAWDAYLFVSEWQRHCFQKAFQLPVERCHLLRNAVAPVFESLLTPASEGSTTAPEESPPTLAYTSTPFRGLDVLLGAFPFIHQEVPDAHLDIFSSLQVYHVPESEDRYKALYAQCRSMPGVTYRGSVPQPELAQALTGISLLAYPNTFPETSCIAVMEALASGCLVVCSDLGALPETTAGLAELVPYEKNHGAFAATFATTVIKTLARNRDPAVRDARREKQRAYAASATWPARAETLTALLDGLPRS